MNYIVSTTKAAFPAKQVEYRTLVTNINNISIRETDQLVSIDYTTYKINDPLFDPIKGTIQGDYEMNWMEGGVFTVEYEDLQVGISTIKSADVGGVIVTKDNIVANLHPYITAFIKDEWNKGSAFGITDWVIRTDLIKEITPVEPEVEE